MNGMCNLTSLDLSQNKITTLVGNVRIDIERAFKHSNLSIDLSKNGFTCTCFSGLSGEICQENIDECRSAPCVNGTCADDVKGYTCNMRTDSTV